MIKNNILFITHAYYNKGGVEEHTRDLSHALKEDFNIYILSPVQIGKLQHYQLIKNNIIYKIYPGSTINWPLAPFRDNLAVHALESTINKINPCLIHIHHLQNWPLEILYQITNTGIPTAFTVHDYFLATPLFTMEFSNHPKELLSKEYSLKVFGVDISDYLIKRREVITNSINKINELITPSQNAKNEITKIIPAQYNVIPHGIYDFLPRFKINQTKKTKIGYIGSIIRQKGWDILIKAFNKIKHKYNDIELNIFGGGYQSAELINVIKNDNSKIIYHGTFNKKDLSNIFSHIDIGVIPSIFKETFCYTLAEMHHAQIPVIASNIGALSEKVTKENGALFKAGDENDLASNLESILINFKSKRWNFTPTKTTKEMAEDYKYLYNNIIR